MKHKPLGPSQELQSLDRKLAALIARRSRLIGGISRDRQNKNKSFADPELEKKLWQIWKKELQWVNPSLVRQAFTLLNSMGYFEAEQPLVDKPFCLYPSRRPLDEEFLGPLDQDLVRGLASMAAICPRQSLLEGINVNDGLLELVKMANECGAGLSWRSSTLVGQGMTSVNLDRRSFFVEHSAFNFYFFLCLGLGHPCRVKFSGSAVLKTMNLRSLQNLLPSLGARLSSIEPQSYSLPAKLEAGGDIPEIIVLPMDVDPEFVKALALAATTYPAALSISYSQDAQPAVESCLRVMSRCGLKAETRRNQDLTVYPGSPCLEDIYDLPVDPLLTGFLLAMAKAGKGRVCVNGAWPKNCRKGEKILHLLEAGGLGIELDINRIVAVDKQPGPKPVFDLTDCPEITPLVFSLALIREDPVPVKLLLPPASIHLDTAADLLNLLGYNYSLDKDGLSILNRKEAPEKSPVWTSPDPVWTLSYCLLSFKFPGVCLSNPGNLSSLWQGFWKLFTNLSPKKMQDNDEQSQKSRRRIRIQGD